MAKREKKPAIGNVTAQDAELIMGSYADVDAKIVEINAKIDQEVTKIRDKYSDKLHDLNDKKDDLFSQLQMFAETHKELFEKKRSIDMAHGAIGFRTGTPKLKTLKGFTWASVTNLLKSFLPDYVRTSEEAAKDKILADRDNPEIVSKMKVVGIEVVQDESFFIDLKKEESEV